MPKRIPGTHFARNLIERRTLIYQLVKRDFQQRYIGSAAGWLWGVIHPIVLLISYSFIFGTILGTKAGNDRLTHNYTLWLFAGMLPWLLFSETVQRSAGSIVEQANLVTKTTFPSEIVPVSIFLSLLISHLMTALVFMAVVGVMLGHINPTIAVLPVFVLIVGMFAIGIGWIVAALQVYLRDTAQVVTVVMTFWLWLTPIFIGEDMYLKRGVGIAALVNPLTYIVRAYRELLLGDQMPSPKDLVIAAVFAVLSFVCGGLFFRHMKRGFADVL